MSMTPFQSYVAPARARPQLWRLAAGLVLCGAVYIGWIAALVGVGIALEGAARMAAWFPRVARPSTPLATLVLLATFAGMAAGPVLAARLLHRRGAASLLGPAGRALRHFAVAAAVLLAVYAAGLLMVPPGGPVPNLAPATWAALLPLTIAGVALQTGAEEVLFRGYLTQQMAARFASPVLWAGLPSALFAAGHFDAAAPTAVAWALVGWAFLFGLLATDLTRVTGSLGAAWGMHFANNVAAIALLAPKDTITGLALYVLPWGAGDGGALLAAMPLELASLLAGWGAIRLVLARRGGGAGVA